MWACQSGRSCIRQREAAVGTAMARLTQHHRAEFLRLNSLCSSSLDSAALRERLGDRLLRHLQADSYCFGATDPATALPVHSVSVGLEPGAMSRFFDLILTTPALDFGAWLVAGRRCATLEQLVPDAALDPLCPRGPAPGRPAA